METQKTLSSQRNLNKNNVTRDIIVLSFKLFCWCSNQNSIALTSVDQ